MQNMFLLNLKKLYKFFFSNKKSLFWRYLDSNKKYLNAKGQIFVKNKIKIIKSYLVYTNMLILTLYRQNFFSSIKTNSDPYFVDIKDFKIISW